MRKYYLFVFSLVLTFTNYGQTTQVIKTFSSSMDATFLRTKEELILGATLKSEENDRLAINNITLEQGDLLINYELFGFRACEKNFNIIIHPTLQFIDGENYSAHPKYLTGKTHSSYREGKQQLQIIWQDFQENFRIPEDSFQLIMQGQLIGLPTIDCNVVPKYNSKTFYLVTGAGIGAIISGFILEDAPMSLGSNLKITGYTILGVNTILYGVRYLSFRRKKKDYDYYCPPKVSVLPYYEKNTVNNISLGMQLAYYF